MLPPRQLVQRAMESASFWALSASALRVLGNLAILPLALHTTPPEQMGLWYFFVALGLFVNLLDLGFYPVVSRSMTYLWSGVPRLQVEGIAPRGEAPDFAASSLELSRLHAVVHRFMLAAMLAALLLLTLTAPGAWQALGKGLAPASFFSAWAIFAVAAALGLGNFFLSAYLTGIHGVTAQQRILTVSYLLNYAVAFAGLHLGGGIFALTTGWLCMNLLQTFLLAHFFHAIAGSRLTRVAVTLSDMREVLGVLWPNARRGWALNLATFFILNTATVVCGFVLGLVTVASYGLTYQILMALAGLSMALLQVKLPEFSMLQASGDIASLRLRFVQRIRISLLLFLLGAAGLAILGPLGLHWIHSRTPLLDTPQLLLLALFIFLQLHHSFYELIVLGENRNPFALPYLAAGFVIAGTTLLLVPTLGVWGMLLPPLLVQLCFNNWWVVLQGIRTLRSTPGAHLRFFFSAPWFTVPPSHAK